MFRDCKTELERNEYKRSKKLQKETDAWLKEHNPDFYKSQRIGSYCDVFEAICEFVEIPVKQGRFCYFVDHRYLFDVTRGYRFENLTPDFEEIASAGLEELKYPEEEVSNDFCKDYNRTIDGLIRLSERIALQLEACGNLKGAQYFRNMKKSPANGFEEALQRILFVNQMFWQMGHRLIGLGHLDWILWPLCQKDMRDGKIVEADVLEMLCDFLKTLHEYYWLKSNVLMGDTGQIIILGGQKKAHYECNELTYLFIKAVEIVALPDPKILLRVSDDMPRKLMEAALQCMQTGVGSPILSNDNQVISKLIAYGVSEADAYEYGTSACWEPLIPGKSASNNNLTYLSYPKVMQRIWEREDVSDVKTFSEWLEIFFEELHYELQQIMQELSEPRFQYSPLLSVFMRDCYQRKCDVSLGGARYFNYGITTVGLSNTINAFLNVKKYVFEEKKYDLDEVASILANNFTGMEDLQEELKQTSCRYGNDDEEVIALTNAILQVTTEGTKGYRNYMRGSLKFGVSAPSYVDAAKDFPATFDGRKKGEAFGVHISSERGNGYTEIINFAAALDYEENRFNGNVVDFMVSPHFIETNFKKMVDLLLAGIRVGFFQLQMNVIGSETLIAAKNNPEKYANLVVRVWGFSAYFHELPVEYQDVLIQRALENEGKQVG